MIMKDLSAWDRFMMKMGALLEKDPEEKKEMQTEYDGVKRENLDNMIGAIRKMRETQRQGVQKQFTKNIFRHTN